MDEDELAEIREKDRLIRDVKTLKAQLHTLQKSTLSLRKKIDKLIQRAIYVGIFISGVTYATTSTGSGLLEKIIKLLTSTL